MNVKTLYNYKAYKIPKIGVFKVETDEYNFPIGWVQNLKEYLIIGEDENNYIHKILPSQHGECVGKKVIIKKYLLPIGLHKSRLLKWVFKKGIFIQIDLFNN